MTLKEIQNRLLLWEATENPLAPLTSCQREAILDIESIILGVSSDIEEVCKTFIFYLIYAYYMIYRFYRFKNLVRTYLALSLKNYKYIIIIYYKYII